MLVFVAYLALAGASTASGRPLPAALMLIALLGLALLRSVFARKPGSAAFVAANLALAVAVLLVAGPRDVLSLTLVIVQATVSALFFRSLQPGRTDLVTQIALGIRAARSAHELAYTRAVAWSWAWFMATLAALSLVFAFAAPPQLWWWWENVCSFAVPVAFFCVEWLLRQWWLRGEEKTGIGRALRALIRIDYQRMFQV